VTADRHADHEAVVDRYLAELDRHLAVSRRYRRRVLAEVADHLSEAIAADRAGGDPDAEPAETARRFGAACRLAAQINAGWTSARARRAPAFAFSAAAGVLAAAVAGIPTVPAPAGPDGGAPVAVFATVASVALQLAVVAGAVSLLRVLARRSASVLGLADRELAWRAARLSVAATAMAGVGFLGVAAVQTHRTGNGAERVVVAALGMLAVLGPVASVLRRPRSVSDRGAAVLAGGMSAEFEEIGSAARSGPVERLARLAERAVLLIQTWPGTVTALVAGVCAVGSYGQAESGRPGSLLAAVVEATAVVVFFRVFGPALGLRAGLSSDGASSGGSGVTG
jgi:hypothetical protein